MVNKQIFFQYLKSRPRNLVQSHGSDILKTSFYSGSFVTVALVSSPSQSLTCPHSLWSRTPLPDSWVDLWEGRVSGTHLFVVKLSSSYFSFLFLLFMSLRDTDIRKDTNAVRNNLKTTFLSRSCSSSKQGANRPHLCAPANDALRADYVTAECR